MWQRWNSGTKIFEKSSDNGVSWTPLGLDASIITQGTFNPAVLPPMTNVAYTNAFNIFTISQRIQPPGHYALLYLKGADNPTPTNGWFLGAIEGGQFGIAIEGVGYPFRIDGASSEILINRLQFPASASPSSIPTTLDEYREGTWTPYIVDGIGGVAGSYSVQVGEYIKVGRLITCSAYVVISSKGTLGVYGDNQTYLDGLPFPATGLASAYGTGGMVQFGGLVTNWISIFALTVPGVQYCLLRGQRGQGGGLPTGLTFNSQPVMVSDLAANAAFVVTFSYFTSY